MFIQNVDVPDYIPDTPPKLFLHWGHPCVGECLAWYLNWKNMFPALAEKAQREEYAERESRPLTSFATRSGNAEVVFLDIAMVAVTPKRELVMSTYIKGTVA